MAVAERVKSIIVEQLGVDEEEVTLEASFTDDLGADSLDIVELVMAFEEEFGIEIPDEEAEKISNVKEAVDYIQNNVGDQNCPPSPASPTAASNPYLEIQRTPSRRRHRGGTGVPAGRGHRRQLDRLDGGAQRHRAHYPLRRIGVSVAHRRRGQGVRSARLRRKE